MRGHVVWENVSCSGEGQGRCLPCFPLNARRNRFMRTRPGFGGPESQFFSFCGARIANFFRFVGPGSPICFVLWGPDRLFFSFCVARIAIFFRFVGPGSPIFFVLWDPDRQFFWFCGARIANFFSFRGARITNFFRFVGPASPICFSFMGFG